MRHRQTGRKATPLIFIALLVAIPACVGDGGSNPTTIDVVGVWKDAEAENFKKVTTAFSAGRNIRVQYTPVNEDDLADDLRARVQKGTAASYDDGGLPDVALLPQPGTMHELVTAKALVPIEDIAGRLVSDNYTPRWRELGSVDGTLYGVWYKASNKSVLWYNEALLRQASVSPPTDWERLKTAAGELAERLDPQISPLALGAADAWTLSDWFENVYLRTAGSENYRALACGSLPWDHSSVVEALNRMTEVLGRQEWIAGRGAALSIPFEESVKEVFGPTPTAAMMSGPDFVASFLSPGALGTDARYLAFPAIGSSKDSIVLGGDVAVLFREDGGGKELLKYLATPEAAQPWAEAGGFISPNKNLSPAVFSNEFFPLVRPVREAGVENVAEFDLSDQLPPALADRGIEEIFQEYLRKPTDTKGIADQLQRVAKVVPRAPCPSQPS